MDEEERRRWIAHCHRMAEASYALADWCEDPEMMADYIRLGGRWTELATAGPASTRRRAPGLRLVG